MIKPSEPIPPFSVRESKRARRVILRAFPGKKLEVVIPQGFDRKSIPAIVERKKAWIDRVFRQMEEGESTGAGADPACLLPDSFCLKALDRTFSVDYRPGSGSTLQLRELGESRLELSGAAEDPEACRSLLRLWLQHQGRRYLVPWVERLSLKTGMAFKKVQVRGQKSRWGSCSSRETISLNYKLLFLPRELVDYILVHELCHTRHLNHSAAFWALVARHEPRYRALDAEVNRARSLVPAWAE